MAAILLRFRLTLSEHCSDATMAPVEHFFVVRPAVPLSCAPI
jgi:hypothetical protein